MFPELIKRIARPENDERLARIQLERAQTLYDKGAIAKSALEQAEGTEQDAKADLDAATEQLRLLGIDKDHPSGVVDIFAPISGVITDQQVTNASACKVGCSQSLHHLRPFLCVDHLRRFTKTISTPYMRASMRIFT